ncbi:MAG: hypothetical protein ACM3ZV_05205 [Bacillota bacterium]
MSKARLSRFEVSWPVQLAAILAFSLYLHSLLWWTESMDLTLYLLPWFDHIVQAGPVGAFAHPFGNYTPPYLYLLALASLFHGAAAPMYIIKLLSVAGTAFAAFATADLLKACGGKPNHAVLLFAVPSVAINAALFGQCDAIWAGACVLAVSSMISGRTVRSLVWCGIAFAFKAQAAFIAPFILGALAGRRAPLWQWAIPPLVFAATMVPARLAGWPAWDLAMIYPMQAHWFDIPGRLANPWIFATVFAPEAAKPFYWLGFAAAAAASAATGALTSTSVGNRRAMLLLAVLSSLALPFLFPKMLERYFFLADLLSIALALAYASRWTVAVAVAVQAASLLTLIGEMYFYVFPWPTLIGAGFSTAALAVTVMLVRRSGARWPQLKLSRGLALQRLPSA